MDSWTHHKINKFTYDAATQDGMVVIYVPHFVSPDRSSRHHNIQNIQVDFVLDLLLRKRTSQSETFRVVRFLGPLSALHWDVTLQEGLWCSLFPKLGENDAHSSDVVCLGVLSHNRHIRQVGHVFMSLDS